MNNNTMDEKIWTTANQRKLIAAAPELLEALKLCQTRIFNSMSVDKVRDPEVTKKLNEEAFQVAKAAIDKATS
jgi:hypothetical protein